MLNKPPFHIKLFYDFLKSIFNQIRYYWTINVEYPKLYPQHKLESLIEPKILNNSSQLIIEGNVQIKNKDISIGKHTYIGRNTIIDSCKSIGAFCSISTDVKIGLRNHPLTHISTSPMFYSKYRGWNTKNQYFTQEESKKTVTIGNDVLISSNAIILNNVNVGTGAVIGAGAIVTCDVPPYSIVAGVPAKVIRYRFPELLYKKIHNSDWWNFSDVELKAAIEKSANPEAFLDHLYSNPK